MMGIGEERTGGRPHNRVEGFRQPSRCQFKEEREARGSSLAEGSRRGVRSVPRQLGRVERSVPHRHD
jgi:hypothetical protein